MGKFDRIVNRSDGSVEINGDLVEVDEGVVGSATSNYQDIGNTRIQWGTQTVDGVVILPKPFANTSYSVTTANTFGVGIRNTQVPPNTKTTTQFTTVAFSSAAQSDTGCDWIAIGVKP